MLQNGEKVKLETGNIIIFDKICKTVHILNKKIGVLYWNNGDNKIIIQDAGSFYMLADAIASTHCFKIQRIYREREDVLTYRFIE